MTNSNASPIDRVHPLSCHAPLPDREDDSWPAIRIAVAELLGFPNPPVPTFSDVEMSLASPV